jgi:hypothetical protein
MLLLVLYLAGFAFFLAAFFAMWSREGEAPEACGILLMAATCALWPIVLALGLVAAAISAALLA